MTPNPSTALSALPRTPCSGYVRHYTASRHKEEATTALAWKDGVLVQKWEISETRDIYCDKAKRDYSHTEYHREEVWRAIPVIPNDKQIAESYFYEEDDASASIEIANIDDLLSVIAFYAGRAVKLTLETMVTTPYVEATSYLNRSGSVAYVTARVPDKLSPEIAAQKLAAIANALTR